MCSVLLPVQAAVPANYPLSGFFISASTSDGANVAKLQAIKAVGGDTVITFGSLLQPAALNGGHQVVSGGKVDPVYAGCLIAGASCISAATAGYSINRVFTFTNGSHWKGAALKCAKDRNVENSGQLYTLLLIPTIDNGCASPNNRYDLVAIYSGKKTDADPTSSLANAATGLGMKL